jgi:hypothetical protein
MWALSQNKRKEGLVINHKKKTVEKMELISRQISPNLAIKPSLTQLEEDFTKLSIHTTLI